MDFMNTFSHFLDFIGKQILNNEVFNFDFGFKSIILIRVWLKIWNFFNLIFIQQAIYLWNTVFILFFDSSQPRLSFFATKITPNIFVNVL